MYISSRLYRSWTTSSRYIIPRCRARALLLRTAKCHSPCVCIIAGGLEGHALRGVRIQPARIVHRSLAARAPLPRLIGNYARRRPAHILSTRTRAQLQSRKQLCRRFALYIRKISFDIRLVLVILMVVLRITL